MQLTDYLSPVDGALLASLSDTSPQALIHFTRFHENAIPDLNGVQLAILGVEEDRFNPAFHGCCKSPDAIRAQFYALLKPKYDLQLADLGNIKAGDSVNDTLFALSATVAYLLDQKIIPVILGGTQDLAYAQFSAYQGKRHALNMVACDARIDLKENENNPALSNYLYKTISHQPNYLFNLVHMANQNYYIEQECLDAFEKMNFDLIRLGNLRTKVQEAEPLLRNADLLVMSMNSIRASDAPASAEANPNGLFGEEACQLMRYAGMANDLSSVGIYDIHAPSDNRDRTLKLASQMLWYFMDGFYNRRNDYPVADSNDYMKYRTTFQGNHYEIVFYKHLYSERWWMEVPYPNERSKQSGMFLVPCNYNDYQMALNNEIPERWMKAYHKLL